MLVLLTDAREIEAVQCGEIPGEQYSDAEVWAEMEPLEMWREQRAKAKQLGTVDAPRE